MLKKLVPAVLAIMATVSAAGASEKSSAEIVQAGLTTAFVNFDVEGMPKYFDDGYIQHNPNVPTGLAALQAVVPLLKEAGTTANIHRMIVDGDLVALHVTYQNAEPFGAKTLVAFDVFRVQDGKIAEHWDNVMAITPPNPSGRTLTDGPTEVMDLDKTAANKALVAEFADRILLGGDFAALPEFISTEKYHQHNPNIADGLDGLAAGFAALAEAGLTVKYDTIHKVIGQGNLVLVLAEGTFGGKPAAYYDLFRIEEGKIVEHWDVVEEIPAEMAHQNGKF